MEILQIQLELISKPAELKLGNETLETKISEYNCKKYDHQLTLLHIYELVKASKTRKL